jgi:hypothetical protein
MPAGGDPLTDNKNRQRNSGEDHRRTDERSSGGIYSNSGGRNSVRERDRADGKISDGKSGVRELRTRDGTKPEQDEEKLAREKARRRRRRQELALRRRKRRRIIRLVRIFLGILVAVLAFAGVMAVAGKYRRDKAKTAADAAAAAETAQTMDTYPASEVLNLTFPVLTLDEAASSSGSAQDGAANQNGTAGQDSTADQDSTSDQQSGTADGSADSDADESVSGSSASETGENTVLTVTDFSKILQDLYDQNYVLTDVSGLAESADGTMKEGTVSVPIGRKPLTITETGVGYTSGYNGHADSLTLKDDGSLTNTYTDSDGKVQTGDVDVITCLDAFVREHPDFSSQNARGIIGVTGQNGMFGYALEASGTQVGKLSADAVREAAENEARYSGSNTGSTDTGNTDTGSTDNGDSSGTAGTGTDLIRSGDGGNASQDRAGTESISADSSGNAGSTGDAASEIAETQVEQNKETLASLITALRDEGWRFASGTFADISYAGDYELVKADADSWEEKIGSLLGDTDILVLPHGGDIGGWSGYSDGDSRYEYLKSLGFRYFMTEDDQEFTWIQTGTDYIRIGMHTITSADTYRSVMNMQ